MQQSDPTPQAAPQVLPAPLPTQVAIQPGRVATPDGQQQAMLRWEVTTPAGQAVFFADRAFAQWIYQALGEHLAAWPSELVVPTVDLEQIRAALGQPNGHPGGQPGGRGRP